MRRHRRRHRRRLPRRYGRRLLWAYIDGTGVGSLLDAGIGNGRRAWAVQSDESAWAPV